MNASWKVVIKNMNGMADGAFQIDFGEVNHVERTNFLVSLTLVTCLGSSQYGFNMWLVNDPDTLRNFFHNISTQIVTKNSRGALIHPALLAFTVAAFTLGCLFSTLLIGPLADGFGRKGVLLVNDIITISATILLAVSKSIRAHGLFALARFVSGMCSGIFSCAVPLYIGEIAPTNLRGSLVILPMLFVTLGVLLSQILGRPEILGNRKGLPFLLSGTAILALFQLVLLLPFPESPRYLLIQQKNEEGARQALQKLRNQLDVEDEIKELHQEDLYERKEKNMTTCMLLRSPRQRWQLTCVVTLLMVQQLSGINAAYYYTEKVLGAMKVDKKNIRYVSAFLTFLLLFAHGVSIYKIDSWGRRPLLLIGIGICIISCVLLTVSLELQVIFSWMSYVSTSLLFAFLIGHTIGPGSIPHLMIAELFLQSSRASAYSVGGFVQWFCVFFIGFTYILIEKYIRSYSFLIFLPCGAIGFFYIYKFVPETKKKTILDIRKFLETFLAKKHLNEIPKAKKKPAKH